jgi:hypothetical protein
LPEKLAPSTKLRRVRPSRRGPSAARGTGDVEPPRGVVDGAVGAHQRGEKFLGLAGAGVAAADADLLARGRGRDLEARGARQLDHRIGFGIVHPARAAIERHLEGRSVGLAAAADLACRLHHDHLAVRRHDPPRRSNAGRACADHDDVGLARQAALHPHAPGKTRVTANAADADRKWRRVIVMSWFPGPERSENS